MMELQRDTVRVQHDSTFTGSELLDNCFPGRKFISTKLDTKIQDTTYKIFYLSFHVYNYTYLGLFTHNKT